jgi:glycosyltransferase involved in cell wall biosynthesis
MNYIPLRTASKIYHLTSQDFQIFAADYPYARRDRFALLRNGVDPPKSTRTRTNDSALLNVLFVGRVDDARKGFAILEAAVAALEIDVRERFVLTVVGSISATTRRRLESTYGDRIRVRGPVSEPDLERAYADADIFVMPSLYEGFGMPYIEAMRYGIPVIGSRAGGVPEVIPAGTGLLTPPGDVDAVAAAITQLVREPALRARIGSAGEAWSKRFHWSTIVDELEADYMSGFEDVQRGTRAVAGASSA